MARTYKCFWCEKRFERQKLINHIDRVHSEMLPEGYDGCRYVYDQLNHIQNGAGTCRVCGAPTAWNGHRYDVLCKNPKCKEKMREEYKKNMLRVKGTYNILNDPEQQKIMLANRKISGKYKHSDGGIIGYTGTYEKALLEFMDNFLQIPSNDIISPGPTMEYEYQGQKHIYIPDFYILSINCIIEIKDGGDNKNNKQSTSMQASREKTLEKERIITDRGEYNYIRLTNNQFDQLIDLFMTIKEKVMNGDDSMTIKINESVDENIADQYFTEASIDDLVTLYHGSDVPNLKVILPKTANAGTSNMGEEKRFRYSSFWFKNFEYAMRYAVNNIIRTKADEDIKRNAIVDNDMKVCIHKKFADAVKKLIMNNDCYVYTAEVPIKDIEYGHTINFPEYTVDYRVVTKSCHKLTNREKAQQIKLCDDEYLKKVKDMYINHAITWGEEDPIRLAVNKAIYFNSISKRNRYLTARTIMNLESAYEAADELFFGE